MQQVRPSAHWDNTIEELIVDLRTVAKGAAGSSTGELKLEVESAKGMQTGSRMCSSAKSRGAHLGRQTTEPGMGA